MKGVPDPENGARIRAFYEKSPSARADVSKRFKGKPKSEEHKAKLREGWTTEKRAQQSRVASDRVYDAEIMRRRGRLGGWSGARSGKETGPEKTVREELERLGLKFKSQALIKRMPYAVWDFVLKKQQVLIEVDGCYWHGCAVCRYPTPPRKATEDKRKNTLALNAGWRLIRIPEHAVKDGSFKAALDGV